MNMGKRDLKKQSKSQLIKPPLTRDSVDKPIQPPSTDRPPQPQPAKSHFNFDDDIFQTENQSLEKFKIISVQSRENKKFKSNKTNSKSKSLRRWTTLKRSITYSKN